MILSQTARPNDSQKKKKKRTCRIVDFAVPVDHRVKLKEIEEKDKYLDLAWELKRAVEHESDGEANCIVTLGTVPKGLEELEIRGRVEIIKTTAFSRLTRILRRVLKT